MSASHSACKLVVLLSGNGSNLQAIIDRIDAGQLDASIVGVISDQAEAHGLQRASDNLIPTTIITANPNENRQYYDHRLQVAIDQYQPDWILLAGFMRILSDDLVTHNMGRLLNVHPSLLPKYKGLNTHQRVLDEAETIHGASVHFVTPSLDDGPVVMQGNLNIDHTQTADQLKHRVHEIEHHIYPKVIQLLCQRRLTLRDGKVWLDEQLLSRPLQENAG